MIESDDDPGGVGEVGLPPIAAAALTPFAANGGACGASRSRWRATPAGRHAWLG